jgi:hypothetical protein
MTSKNENEDRKRRHEAYFIVVAVEIDTPRSILVFLYPLRIRQGSNRL